MLEFDINDDRATDISDSSRCKFEQLLRKLLRGEPAVVMLHHYAFNVARDKRTRTAGVFYWQTEQHFSTFARVRCFFRVVCARPACVYCADVPALPSWPQYYDIPSVSIAAAAWRLMHAGIEGFRVGGEAGHCLACRLWGQSVHMLLSVSRLVVIALCPVQTDKFVHNPGLPVNESEYTLAAESEEFLFYYADK